MVRLTDQMTAIKKIVCFSQLPRGGGVPCYVETHVNHQGKSRGRSEGKASVTTLIVFFCRMKGSRQGNQAEQM